MTIQVQLQSSAQPGSMTSRKKKVKDIVDVSAVGDDTASIEV
jgi:hypothetical protein